MFVRDLLMLQVHSGDDIKVSQDSDPLPPVEVC